MAGQTLAAGTPPRGRVPFSLRHLAGALLVLGLGFALVGALVEETFYLRLGTEALILAGVAISVDLLLGYTGLLSLGQALYFGLGAYVAAILLREGYVGFWGALLASLALAVPVALAAGAVAIRSRGVYFILITFGLAQVAAKAVYNTRAIGGSDGMTGVPVLQAHFGLFSLDLGNPVSFFLLMVVLMTALYLGLSYLMRSPFGRILIAIRSNEHRVRFLGFNTWRYKLAAYVLAALVATLCGALYPMLRGFVSPELLYFEVSVDALIAAIIGGVGTLIGPIVGSVILVVLRTIIGGWTEHHHMVIGALFMLVVIFAPQGIAGLFRREPPDALADDGEDAR